jgi:regulator of protease activity HflC (stomatin/prohibitin superfamily)
VTRSIREILDRQTKKWGVTVTDFKFENVQLPAGTRPDMARRIGVGHEQRAKLIAAEDNTVTHVIEELGAVLSGAPHGNGRLVSR